MKGVHEMMEREKLLRMIPVTLDSENLMKLMKSIQLVGLKQMETEAEGKTETRMETEWRTKIVKGVGRDLSRMGAEVIAVPDKSRNFVG